MGRKEAKPLVINNNLNYNKAKSKQAKTAASKLKDCTLQTTDGNITEQVHIQKRSKEVSKL